MPDLDLFAQVSLCNAAVVALSELDALLAAEHREIAAFARRCEDLAQRRA